MVGAEGLFSVKNHLTILQSTFNYNNALHSSGYLNGVTRVQMVGEDVTPREIAISTQDINPSCIPYSGDRWSDERPYTP